MRKTELHYVPSHYTSTQAGRIVMWGREGSDAFASIVVPDCLIRIERLLDYQLQRTLHVVVYESNVDACQALGRSIGPSVLMSPFHGSESAVIALQGASADPRNVDVSRMCRHLCHEIAHVFSAERTQSLKRLGDGSRGMRLPAWVDEGFAENVAAAAAERPDVIRNAMTVEGNAKLSTERMAAAFEDLSSRDRKLAFAVATSQIWRAIKTHGWREFFANLPRIGQLPHDRGASCNPLAVHAAAPSHSDAP